MKRVLFSVLFTYCSASTAENACVRHYERAIEDAGSPIEAGLVGSVAGGGALALPTVVALDVAGPILALIPVGVSLSTTAGLVLGTQSYLERMEPAKDLVIEVDMGDGLQLRQLHQAVGKVNSSVTFEAMVNFIRQRIAERTFCHPELKDINQIRDFVTQGLQAENK